MNLATVLMNTGSMDQASKVIGKLLKSHASHRGVIRLYAEFLLRDGQDNAMVFVTKLPLGEWQRDLLVAAVNVRFRHYEEAKNSLFNYQVRFKEAELLAAPRYHTCVLFLVSGTFTTRPIGKREVSVLCEGARTEKCQCRVHMECGRISATLSVGHNCDH